MSEIDPRAVVSPSREFGAGVSIGAYRRRRRRSRARRWLHSRSPRRGAGPRAASAAIITFIRSRSSAAIRRILPITGERVSLEVGDDNVFREFSTVNRGTVKGGGVTRLGSHNLFMSYAHIAHDCVVGDHTIFVNGATLAGHVTVEDYAADRRFLPGAPVLPHRAAFLHRRAHRDHAGRAALFDGRRAARHALLRRQYRRPRAPAAFRPSASKPSSRLTGSCCAPSSTPRRPSKKCVEPSPTPKTS